ncbi:MAG: DNA-3-methyladenine glycosylase [Kribbellaceae bacterium]
MADLLSVLSGQVLDAAPQLLGAVLRSTVGGDQVDVRLTEVEAYDGPDDAGSHAYRGWTARNAVMFGPPGHLYVYFTYGMHFCMNIVCGPPGRPSAVLLRAGEIVAGAQTARARRAAAGKPNRELARGPARMCQALGIDREQNGVNLFDPAAPVRLFPGSHDGLVETGPRVGLREAADHPWRFWISGEPTVSTYRPHQPKRRP